MKGSDLSNLSGKMNRRAFLTTGVSLGLVGLSGCLEDNTDYSRDNVEIVDTGVRKYNNKVAGYARIKTKEEMEVYPRIKGELELISNGVPIGKAKQFKVPLAPVGQIARILKVWEGGEVSNAEDAQLVEGWVINSDALPIG